MERYFKRKLSTPEASSSGNIRDEIPQPSSIPYVRTEDDLIGDDVFALLVDESSDISKKEQMAVVLRYVTCGIVKERFIGIVHVKETSAYLDRMDILHELSTYPYHMQQDERFANLKSVSDLAKVMVETKMHEFFPLIYRLVKLTLILPVATATVERCFSVMKLVKSNLRNRISDGFLNDCVICAVEREGFSKVTDEDIIKRFSVINPRRFQFQRKKSTVNCQWSNMPHLTLGLDPPLLLHEDQLILDRLSLTTFNETPLHIAAMRGHLHFATVVLTHKPKLAMALDSQRRTPLHLAAANCNLEIVQELIRVGSGDVCGVQDQDGLTPVHLAAMNELLEVLKALIQANPQAAKETPATGETILHMSLKVLTELWNEEELAKITDHGGNTLLHVAAINKRIQILNFLLRIPSIKGNGNAVNRHGLTALDVLDQCPRDLQSLETQQILIEAGVLRANDLRPLPNSNLQPSANFPQTKRKGTTRKRAICD
ncbi:hypothetical protein LXL04_015545 [Taraxacum kok-saghyz]